ncbi:hypothetical protein T01_8246 [Trichinella spiralis]|uniref:Uncharacterized protein n=1 Tax=Trichinella spiralis TaxID=6334 RepID=A0A0V1BXH0_TRISP|nr:hypothetical protein T01_8246 [Trichinella spiralis]
MRDKMSFTSLFSFPKLSSCFKLYIKLTLYQQRKKSTTKRKSYSDEHLSIMKINYHQMEKNLKREEKKKGCLLGSGDRHAYAVHF